MNCVQAEELAKSKLEKVKRLQQQAHRDWQEIKHGSLKFQRRQQEADAIRSLHKSDLVAFFKVQRSAGRLVPFLHICLSNKIETRELYMWYARWASIDLSAARCCNCK